MGGPSEVRLQRCGNYQTRPVPLLRVCIGDKENGLRSEAKRYRSRKGATFKALTAARGDGDDDIKTNPDASIFTLPAEYQKHRPLNSEGTAN